jgi:hypothetical protein
VQIHTGDLVIIGEQANLIHGIHPADLRAELEQGALSGEQFFGSYRLALQSRSPVEKFMHLYQLLLRFFGDDQPTVDDCIRSQDATVPQTPDPRLNRSHIMETVYTRLRNEFAHRRVGVDLHATKAEMEQRVEDLSSLTKHAIAMQP